MQIWSRYIQNLNQRNPRTPPCGTADHSGKTCPLIAGDHPKSIHTTTMSPPQYREFRACELSSARAEAGSSSGAQTHGSLVSKLESINKRRRCAGVHRHRTFGVGVLVLEYLCRRQNVVAIWASICSKGISSLETTDCHPTHGTTKEFLNNPVVVSYLRLIDFVYHSKSRLERYTEEA